jgi:hypothetical protein
MILFGLISNLIGDEDKGTQILNNCFTAFVLYWILIEVFIIGTGDSGILNLNIPFVEGIRKYGTLKEYLNNSVGMFALDFAQLVTLVLLINWISNILSFENAGFAGKVSSKLVIVVMAIIAYGFFMAIIEDNGVFKWCVYCIECLITGGSIIYTPVMVVTFITGIKEENYANSYIISQFPKTSFGKAVTTAISSSLVFVIFWILLDMQYGGIGNVIDSVADSFSGIAASIIMLMGIYFLSKSLFRKKK